MNYFRYRGLGRQDLDSLAEQFAAAQPFPHLVISDFLSLPPEEVLPSLPAPHHASWRRHTDPHEAGKSSFNDLSLMGEPLAAMMRELNSPECLQFVERVTGITGLLTDPYLAGAGLLASGPGGVCAPHTDTHIREGLNIFRRVNMLVYLNPGWEECFGGCLELYDRTSRPERHLTVVPRWGTCIIFPSDGSSVHGFSQPVAAGRTRYALAAYYYTSVDNPRFSGAPMTMWRQHERYWRTVRGGPVIRLGRMYLYRCLRFGSKAFAYLAHKTGPRPARAKPPDTHR